MAIQDYVRSGIQTSDRLKTFGRNFKKHWVLTVMILPGLIWYIIFKYVPMYGIAIAFQRYRIGNPIISESANWVGFFQFKTFFSHPQSWRLIRNTLLLNIYQLIFAFPIPIIFALFLNEMRNKYLKMSNRHFKVFITHFI